MRKTTMFLAGLAIAAPALAVTVPSTGDVTLALPGTTSVADPSLAASGTDTAVNFATPAGVSPAVSGTLQLRVAKSKTAGVMIYSYRLINSPNSGASIRALNVIGFPLVIQNAN